MKKMILLFWALSLAACAGTYSIKGSPNALSYHPQTVSVENNDGKSADMDAHMQRALISKGLKISSPNSPADLVVKYTDKWQWDVSMYLNALHVTFYDKAGNILAIGSYENSFWHEFPNPANTVQKVIDGMFAELGSSKVTQTQKP